MKQRLLILLFTIVSSISFGQTNPEDIIIVYDSINPNGKMVLKSELSSNLDSLNTHLIDDKRNELLTKKDILTIKKLLVGNWKLEGSRRINGEPFNLQVAEQITFERNRNFIQISKEDTIQGKWFLKNEINGNLLLKYDEPQISIKDKNILKYLPKEQIKAITYTSNTLSIMEINEQSLIFISFIPVNARQIDNMFYRLVLTLYTKKE